MSGSKPRFGKAYTIPKDLVIEVEDIEQEDRDMFLEFTPYGTVTAGDDPADRSARAGPGDRLSDGHGVVFHHRI